MTTRRVKRMVSMASGVSAALFAAVLGLAACASGQHRPHPKAATMQFDNAGTVHVDVYLVNGRLQWRLGRVLPGMRAMFRVPASAIESTAGLTRLVAIPGSQISPQVERDPRAVFAIAQPMSEILSQRWTFRQTGASVPQLHGMRLDCCGASVSERRRGGI